MPLLSKQEPQQRNTWGKEEARSRRGLRPRGFWGPAQGVNFQFRSSSHILHDAASLSVLFSAGIYRILEVLLRISIVRNAFFVDEGVCGSVFSGQNVSNLSRWPSIFTCAFRFFGEDPRGLRFCCCCCFFFFFVEVCDVIHEATRQSKTAPFCTASAVARHHSWPLPRRQGNARALSPAHLCTQTPRCRSSQRHGLSS